MNKILCIPILLIIPLLLSGQRPDTSVLIPPVTITESRPFLTGLDTADQSHLPLSAPLSRLLRTRGNLYIKDYGPGSSATLSMNGGKANEVSLIWDGITVSNPMLGLNDFSLISTGEEYHFRIADMTSAAVLGAGSIAGAVLMDPTWEDRTSALSAAVGASSLHQTTGRISFAGNKNNYRHQTTINSQTAKNNFKYKDITGRTRKMEHARTRHLDGRHHSQFVIRPQTLLSASVWMRNQFRELPPTLTEVQSRATQEDEFIRSVLTLQHTGKTHILRAKAYYGYQHQKYTDPDIRLDARHRFQNAQIKLDNDWSISSSLVLKYGIHENHFTSHSDNYNDTKTQNRLSLYSQVTWDIHPQMGITALIRPEKVSDHSAEWVSNFQWYISPRAGEKWILHGSRNIAWPTLNDLYWMPGGNPELLPEENWWAGVTYQKSWKKQLRTKIKGFHRRSKNWIQWIPDKKGIWSPENYRSGRIYGINIQAENKFSSHFAVSAKYQYVRVFFPDHSAENLQAVYTPVHTASGIALYQPRPGINLYVNAEYTSTRYVLQDHSEKLAPYFIISPGVRYRISDHWEASLDLHNALNTEYQGIKNRPMPGRIIEINTHYKF